MPQPASNPPSASRTDLVDPRALMRLKSLELRARVIVEGFWKGIHRSPHHGFSVEFTEYRQYSPGDDTRYLDWRVLARSDRHFIKKYEDETNLRVYLLVDQSRSMGFGSLPYTKAQYAATLAATLACFLDGQGDAVGLMAFDTAIRAYLPPRHRPGHLRRLMHHLDAPAAGPGTDLRAPLQRVAQMLTRRSMLILISDLLAPIDRLSADLGYLRARGHEVVVFQPLDPAEMTFAFDGPAHFEDVESGRRLYIDPAAARQSYQARLHAHLDAVATICAHLGIDHHRFTTDRPLEMALFDYLSGRPRRANRPRVRSGKP
jgi:uncharacterized protein (DUF58 family)